MLQKFRQSKAQPDSRPMFADAADTSEMLRRFREGEESIAAHYRVFPVEFGDEFVSDVIRSSQRAEVKA